MCFSTGSYMIVAPKVIRPGRPYAASVNLIDVPGKAIVELQIKNSKNESIDRIFVRDAEPGKFFIKCLIFYSIYIHSLNVSSLKRWKIERFFLYND